MAQKPNTSRTSTSGVERSDEGASFSSNRTGGFSASNLADHIRRENVVLTLMWFSACSYLVTRVEENLKTA